MPLSAGDKLGPYEILSAIGKGGMGEVWRAHDPRLGRDVAIKVSAQQFTDRFEREEAAGTQGYRTPASISDAASATRLNWSGPISEMLATTDRSTVTRNVLATAGFKL
jgi:hypothetical protein